MYSGLLMISAKGAMLFLFVQIEKIELPREE
jgi:hypothetical protein